LIQHINILVTGKVQGVYYRASAKQKADQLGAKGFVRNQPNASVYIEAEASYEVLQKFIEWCWQGPERAQVQHVETTAAPVKTFTEFEVRK